MQRVLNGDNLRAEDFAHLLHDVVVVGFFSVKLVECEDYGFVYTGSGAEDVLCAYFYAVLGVDNDKACVCDVECRYGIAYEVVSSRAVDDVELLAKELGIYHGGEHGGSVFLLYREVVAYGVLCFDCAAAFYHSTLEEHSFCECGFPGSLAAQQGDVFNFVGLIYLHVIRWFLDNTMLLVKKLGAIYALFFDLNVRFGMLRNMFLTF